MLPYSRQLKQNSRELRSHMTDAEQKLWYRLRRKQINGWQFYRQKPLGPYIVDFYSPEARLVIELDGSQHFEPEHQVADQKRDAYLASLGLRVLRFDNRQVLLETDAVIGVIAKFQISPGPPEIPPSPPFSKWGTNQSAHEGAAFEQKTPTPVTPFKKNTDTSAPHFEKEIKTPIPHFEKGGVGGICVDAPMLVEKEA